MSDFDREILAEIHDIDPATLVTVIDSFIDKWPGTIGEIDAAIQDADADGLMRLAHKLKGGGRTIGLVALGNICQRIEHAARNGDLAGCRMAMPELIAAGEAAITFLESVRDQPPSG